MVRSSSAEPAKATKCKGTRSASTLTPSQLARKRANDREAQRAIRARTKEHIERLERELEELKSKQSWDQFVLELLRRNKALEDELNRLKNMGISTGSSPFSTPVYDDNLSTGSDAITSPINSRIQSWDTISSRYGYHMRWSRRDTVGFQNNGMSSFTNIVAGGGQCSAGVRIAGLYHDILDSEGPLPAEHERMEHLDRQLHYMEDKGLPDVSAIDSQVDDLWSMRPELIELLTDAHASFTLLPQTLFLAINPLDRYCSKQTVYAFNSLSLYPLKLPNLTSHYLQTLRASSTTPRTSGRPADHQVHREFITISSDASSGFKNSRVKCKHCGHETAKGTTRQKKHLLRHCPNYRGQQQSEQSQLTQHFPVVDKTFKQMLDELAARAIFADGHPFNLFESKRMRILLSKLNTAWQPPSRRRVQRLLAPTYSEYHNQVQDILDQTERINVIFDGSDNITSHRIINISIQVANGLAFYWKTFDTGQIQHTAEHYIDILYPELEIICKGNFLRINSFCTDTDSVMRQAHVHLAARKEFQHCFFSLCDSHGLQLLIKDILEQPFFEEAFKSATLIVTFFKKSKLQLARLREAQKAAWGHHKAFLSAAITRWGSQFNSLWSALRCKEPLQTYARRPDVRAELASGSLELLPRVLESVNNPHFWIRLETVLAIIKPVSSRQHASEADRAHIGHVIPRWLEIKAEWKALDDSQQHKDVNFSELYSVWLNRMDKQTYDIHYAGFALRPDTVGTKLEEQLMMKVLQFFKSAVNPADYLHIVREFNHFRAQSGGRFAAGGLVYSKEWTPLDAWILLDNQGSKLAALAARIFGTIANSIPSERSFSAVNFLHSKARNRLTPANADKLAFIYMNERVLERITQSQNQPLGHRDEVDSTVVSWEDLTEDGWLTLEDK
ncbi:hypothetical protein FOBRF1_007024 [Fusarium oxysporum]